MEFREFLNCGFCRGPNVVVHWTSPLTVQTVRMLTGPYRLDMRALAERAHQCIVYKCDSFANKLLRGVFFLLLRFAFIVPCWQSQAMSADAISPKITAIVAGGISTDLAVQSLSSLNTSLS